jgi:hypothetical protein
VPGFARPTRDGAGPEGRDAWCSASANWQGTAGAEHPQPAMGGLNDATVATRHVAADHRLGGRGGGPVALLEVSD